MNVWMTTLLFAVTTFKFVDSGCHSFRSRTDYEALCWKWWEKSRYYSDAGKAQCVNLVKRKCPHMVDIQFLKYTREYKTSRYEEWSRIVTATFKSKSLLDRTYNDKEYPPVCWDDNGKVFDCNYWWKVAKNERVENKIKERCINRILHHCKNTISQVSESSPCTVQRCYKGYEVKTVTYKKGEGDTASFNRYESV